MNDMRSRVIRSRGADGSPLVSTKRPSGARTGEGLHSMPVPREAGRTRDTRTGDRHRLAAETLTVTHKRRKRKVELINLSAGGAMVAADGFTPKLWDRVDLHLGPNGTVECTVRWLKRDRVGLEFAQETRLECPEVERDALLQAVLQRDSQASATQAAPPEATEAPAEDEAGSAPAVEHPHRRSDSRHALIWSGFVHYDHDSRPVRLRNISPTGAMIECATPLPVGAEPLLDLGEAGSLFATVSWARGEQVGLSFKQPFDLAQLARAKPEVAPAKWEKPSYLNGAAEPSPWQDHWDALSARDLNQELDGFLKR